MQKAYTHTEQNWIQTARTVIVKNAVLSYNFSENHQTFTQVNCSLNQNWRDWNMGHLESSYIHLI